MDEGTRAAAALLAAGAPNAARRAVEESYGHLSEAVAALADAETAAERGEWAACATAAARAVDALDHGVEDADATEYRSFATTVAADPETVERRPAPTLRTSDGAPVTLGSLDAPVALLAGETLADVRGDEDLLAGFEYARADLADGEAGSEFVRLALDALQVDAARMPAERLRQHASRRRAREEDVEGLFD